MAVENSHGVWIWGTCENDQLVNKLNMGTNKLFPLFEGVHRNNLVTKGVGTIALPFHSTLIAF